ncbi:MAG: winged helix-turn-helix transcriptional regulator [Patescibacteria group bacterium]|nr:winged helix-turn-helix transcriptional regulator [Patescibacteria group bacterium]
MTMRLMRRAWKQRAGNGHRKFVLVCLAFAASGKGNLYYNRLDEIAQVTGMSERTVKRHVEALASEGLLEVSQTSVPRTIHLTFA